MLKFLKIVLNVKLIEAILHNVIVMMDFMNLELNVLPVHTNVTLVMVLMIV